MKPLCMQFIKKIKQYEANKTEPTKKIFRNYPVLFVYMEVNYFFLIIFKLHFMLLYNFFFSIKIIIKKIRQTFSFSYLN